MKPNGPASSAKEPKSAESPETEAGRSGLLAGVGEAAAFLGSGAAAIVEFFAGPTEATPNVDEEIPPEEAAPTTGVADRIEALAAKIAPFPGQEG